MIDQFAQRVKSGLASAARIRVHACSEDAARFVVSETYILRGERERERGTIVSIRDDSIRLRFKLIELIPTEDHNGRSRIRYLELQIAL